MSEESQGGSVVMAGVYFLLALFAVGVIVLGVTYVTGDDVVQKQLFFIYGKNRITKGSAGPFMIGVGALLSVGMTALGVYRLKKPIGSDA